MEQEKGLNLRILGIDPGLNHTGWGVIDFDGYKLTHVDHGVIHTKSSDNIQTRMKLIFDGLMNVIKNLSPEEASIEQVFVNDNALSSLKLGMARGAALCALGMANLNICEYAPNKIKKTITGTGHGSKNQIEAMVAILLNCKNAKLDAADALAIAICRAHHNEVFYSLTG